MAMPAMISVCLGQLEYKYVHDSRSEDTDCYLQSTKEHRSAVHIFIMPLSLLNPFKSSKSQRQTTEKAQKSVRDDSSSVYSDAATLVAGKEQSPKSAPDSQDQRGLDFSSMRYSMVPSLIFAFVDLTEPEC
jgi:hypothetical protein